MQLLALLLSVVCAAEVPSAKPRIAIRCKKAVTVSESNTVFDHAVILVEDGKIASIGRARDVEIPDGYEVVDAGELWAVPGLVECHNHISGSLMDLNDGVFLSNPGLRTLDTVEPDNQNLLNARAGGVTTTLLIPGSGNNMSGFGTLVKTAGNTLDEMLVKFPGSLKIAQSGNPERYWYGVSRSFMNWNTRDTLIRAREYHDAWNAYEEGRGEKPDFDPVWDGFRGLFRKEFPTSVHTQIYQVVAETIQMQVDELGLWAVLDHSTFDAFKLAEETSERDMFVINGPRQLHFDRQDRKVWGNADQWWARAGGKQKLGINTDAPVIPQEQLSYQCAMAVHFGMPQSHGLAAVTRIPAQSMGLYHRLGSLEAGKDADIGLWTGDPIDPASACLMLLVNGEVCYDSDIHGRRF